MIAALAVAALATAAAASPAPAPTVLFVCEHGSVKSLLARRLFEREAARAGLAVKADSRGTAPDEAVPDWMKAALAKDGLAAGKVKPTRVTEGDVKAAARVVTFDLELPVPAPATLERWDGVPPVSKDYEKGRDAILARVKELVMRLKAEAPAP